MQFFLSFRCNLSLLSTIQGSWAKKIIERVHNIRSACAKKCPAIDDGQGTPVKRRRPKGLSLLNRYRQLPEGLNDDASNQRNITALQKEMEKEKPRKDVVLSLMNQQHPER